MARDAIPPGLGLVFCSCKRSAVRTPPKSRHVSDLGARLLEPMRVLPDRGICAGFTISESVADKPENTCAHEQFQQEFASHSHGRLPISPGILFHLRGRSRARDSRAGGAAVLH